MIQTHNSRLRRHNGIIKSSSIEKSVETDLISPSSTMSSVACSKRRPRRETIPTNASRKTNHFIASISSPIPRSTSKPSSTKSIKQAQRLAIDDKSNQRGIRTIVPTVYEVDAPREISVPLPNQSRSTRGLKSILGEGEVEDQWAGINDLLERQRMDESSHFSTSDILPPDIVKKMRKKKSSGNRSKNDALSPKSSAADPRRKHRKKTTKKKRSQSLSPVKESPRQESTTRQVMSTRAERTTGTIFDVFVWSEKSNIDELVNQKKKLNKSRKVNNSVYDVDDQSLPSLESFTTRHRDASSVVTEDVLTAHNRPNSNQVAIEDHNHRLAVPAMVKTDYSEETEMTDALVLDKEVDAHITKLQKQLSLVRNGDASITSTVIDGGESASKLNGITENSPMQNFLAWNPIADPSSKVVFESDPAKRHSNRAKDSKTKHSYAPSKFMNSLKRFKAPKTPMPSRTSVGDDAKYFPRDEKMKSFSSSRDLLADSSHSLSLA